MKKTILLLILLMPMVIVPLACSHNKNHQHENEKKISHYTCPMHPQVRQDHPGECPICNMTLVPVYKESSPEGKSSPEGVQISPERQQLIGITSDVVKKRSVTKEIRTNGRVAFDPELAVAIREYQETVQNAPSLKKAAQNRLRLLGLSEKEIRSFEKKGNPNNLYLPQTSQPVWVYGSLYENEMNLVKPGQQAKITLPSGNENFTGTIRGIDPVVDPLTRSVKARIEVPHAGGLLKPEAYVNVSLQVDLGEVMAIPTSAVVATGTRNLVFVIHDGIRFEPREVRTKAQTEEWVVVTSGLSEGERIATSSAFLIDSESQLKTAFSSAKEVPNCPEGEAWNAGMNMCMPQP